MPTPEPAAAPGSGKRKLLILIAVLGVAIYMAMAMAVDAHLLKEALQQLGLVGSGVVLALSLLNYLLRFVRWDVYLKRLGHSLPARRHLLYYLIGFAATVSPAKAGEAVRSIYMRTHGVTYAESIGTLFVERLLDLVAIVILASLVAYDNPTYRPLLLGIALAALLLVMIVGHPMLPRLLERLSARYHSPRMAKALNAGHNLLLSSRRLLSPAPLLFGISLGLVAWGAEGLGFYFICQSMQLNIDLHTSIGIYSLAALAGSAAIFLPGGIGGMEIVMTALLTAHGAPLSAALIATLLCRLATLWFAVVIGLATTALLEFNSRQSETTAASA